MIFKEEIYEKGLHRLVHEHAYILSNFYHYVSTHSDRYTVNLYIERLQKEMGSLGVVLKRNVFGHYIIHNTLNNKHPELIERITCECLVGELMRWANNYNIQFDVYHEDLQPVIQLLDIYHTSLENFQEVVARYQMTGTLIFEVEKNIIEESAIYL